METISLYEPLSPRRTHDLTHTLVQILAGRSSPNGEIADLDVALVEGLAGRTGDIGWAEEFVRMTHQIVPSSPSWQWYDGRCREGDPFLRRFITHLGKRYYGPVAVEIMPGRLSFIGEHLTSEVNIGGQLSVESIPTENGPSYTIDISGLAASKDGVLEPRYGFSCVIPPQLACPDGAYPNISVVDIGNEGLTLLKDGLLVWGNVLHTL